MLGSLKFNSAKCETTCRLCLGRIKLLKNKRNMQMKMYRKDIAELLRAGKQDYARIRVEAVIREQLTLTAYEILELYLELLAVRSSLVATSKEIPRDMVEALSSVLYASSRVPDLPELTTLHKMFMQKYGKEYVAEACSDVSCSRWMVNDNLRHCLTIEPPEPALKLETLSEIAQEFGVEWDMDRARRDLLGDADAMMMALHPPPPPAAAAGPIPGSSVLYQQQQQQQQQSQMPHQQQPGAAVGAGGYADVAAAAAAAVAAAMQAKTAAEAAARLAGANSSGPHPPKGGAGDGSGSGSGSGGGGMLTSGQSAGPPAEGWLTGITNSGTHMTPPPPPAAATAAAAAKPPAGTPLQMHPLPGPPAGAAGAGAAGVSTDGAAAAAGRPVGYRIPSSEEIQRAYDTAQGPPAKPTAAAAAAAPGDDNGVSAAPPGAPPVAAGDTAAATAAASNGDGVSDGDLGLPGVPHSGGVSVGSSSTRSEYDELQMRFEALKKS